MFDRILSTIAPYSCCGCGEVGTELCDGCKYDIVSEPFGACVSCLRPTFGDNLCANCSHFGADGVWCVGYRQDTLKVLLDNYKFEAMRGVSSSLVELLDITLPSLSRDIIVTTIPTASAHVRERGFDHMQQVGRGFAAKRGMLYVPLLRRRSSSTQHLKSRHERQKAAQRAFELTTPKIDRDILLIDDILTTGFTVRAALDLLHRGGAKTLHAAIIARQPLDDSDDLW